MKFPYIMENHKIHVPNHQPDEHRQKTKDKLRSVASLSTHMISWRSLKDGGPNQQIAGFGKCLPHRPLLMHSAKAMHMTSRKRNWRVWLLVGGIPTPLKNISQWEGLSHILWKHIKFMFMFQTTNQIIMITIEKKKNCCVSFMITIYYNPLSPNCTHLLKFVAPCFLQELVASVSTSGIHGRSTRNCCRPPEIVVVNQTLNHPQDITL